MKFDRKDAKSWAIKNIQYYYEAPLTPTTAELKLDEPGMYENLDAYLDMGIKGLVVGGFLAEGWNMTLSEWCRFTR